MKHRRGSTGGRFPRDWSVFVGLLQRHRVRFLIVGAHALAALGRPRYTEDLDIFVEPTRKNAVRICAALRDFGFGVYADVDYFAEPGEDLQGIQLGIEPLRIDVIKSLPGVSFAEAWRGSVRTSIDGHRVRAIGRKAFLKNKRAAGRAKDLSDIGLLEEIGVHPRGTSRRRRR